MHTHSGKIIQSLKKTEGILAIRDMDKPWSC